MTIALFDILIRSGSTTHGFVLDAARFQIALKKLRIHYSIGSVAAKEASPNFTHASDGDWAAIESRGHSQTLPEKSSSYRNFSGNRRTSCLLTLRSELEQLLSTERNFPERGDAASLLRQLQ